MRRELITWASISLLTTGCVLSTLDDLEGPPPDAGPDSMPADGVDDTAEPPEGLLYDNFGPAGFVLDGRRWDRLELTWCFRSMPSSLAPDAARRAWAEAVRLWTDETYLTFVERADCEGVDIEVGWGAGEHGDGFPFDGLNGVLAHAFYPPPNRFAGDIHFCDAERWTDALRDSGQQPIDLVTVAAHELGHALGLGHSEDPTALMFPRYMRSHRFLSDDDWLAITALYPVRERLIEVPGADVDMGHAQGNPDEGPVHRVRVSGFAIDRTPVTNYQYARCVADGVCEPPLDTGSQTRRAYHGLRDFQNHPVVNVTWQQAHDYCEFRGLRLPTEAEWERATRGGDGATYAGDGEVPDCSAALFGRGPQGPCQGVPDPLGDSSDDTHRVGVYPGARTASGLHDVSGHVWQWTADWYGRDYYLDSPQDDPQGPDRAQASFGARVIRGNSFLTDGAEALRLTYRYAYEPDLADSSIGFRCAR